MKEGDIRNYLVPVQSPGDRLQTGPSPSRKAQVNSIEDESAPGPRELGAATAVFSEPHALAGPSGTTHRRSRMQLNEPHFPSGRPTFSFSPGRDFDVNAQKPAHDVIPFHSGFTVPQNVRSEHEQPQATPEFPSRGPRNVRFEPGSRMIQHIYNELEGLGRNDLTAIFNVVTEALASLPEDPMVHRSETRSSHTPPTLEGIEQILNQINGESRDFRREVKEFVSNIVRLQSELNQFKSTIDNVLNSMQQRLHSLEVEVNSLKASKRLHIRSQD